MALKCALAALFLCLGLASSFPNPARAEAGGGASAPTLLDMNGMWARRTVRHGPPDHFDPNVLEIEDQRPPLKDAYMQVWKDNIAKGNRGDLSFDTSVARCLPKGFPRIMMAPLGMEIMATPRQVNLYNEASEETVRVYLDGRQELPEHSPTYDGFTTGVWDGAVLTTETRNLKDDTIFDVSGIPHSDALTVTQKFRFLDKNTLENLITAHDPKAFTKDWVVRMVYTREPPGRYADEFVCEENNHDASRTGKPK